MDSDTAQRSSHLRASNAARQTFRADRDCIAELEQFPFYTFRHTCLTRWSLHMDPYTLAYFAGHSDFSTTRRYVHPKLETGRDAMERAAGAHPGHSSGHSAELANQTEERESALIH